MEHFGRAQNIRKRNYGSIGPDSGTLMYELRSLDLQDRLLYPPTTGQLSRKTDVDQPATNSKPRLDQLLTLQYTSEKYMHTPKIIRTCCGLELDDLKGDR